MATCVKVNKQINDRLSDAGNIYEQCVLKRQLRKCRGHRDGETRPSELVAGTEKGGAYVLVLRLEK